MKTIYFVRHGEAEVNVSDFYGDGTSPLTERGRAQAQFVAHRCAKLPIQTIIASTMTRAQQTAAIIAAKTPHTVVHSELFRERRRPSQQLHQRKDDPHVLEVNTLITENFSQPHYRFSDEENFDDLKERAGHALTYLENLTEDHVLVVTHGFFLRTLIAAAIFGKDMNAYECERFVRTFHMENTGLTVLGYDEKYERSPWWLWVWNDHAHLG